MQFWTICSELQTLEAIISKGKKKAIVRSNEWCISNCSDLTSVMYNFCQAAYFNTFLLLSNMPMKEELLICAQGVPGQLCSPLKTMCEDLSPLNTFRSLVQVFSVEASILSGQKVQTSNNRLLNNDSHYVVLHKQENTWAFCTQKRKKRLWQTMVVSCVAQDAQKSAHITVGISLWICSNILSTEHI